MFYNESDLEILNSQIAEAQLTISRIMAVGQSRTNDSGGSSNAFTEADLTKARLHLNTLLRTRREIDGSGGGGSIAGVSHCR